MEIMDINNCDDLFLYSIIERNEIRKISNSKTKVEWLLNLLKDNNVSPIHLVDILGSYVDEYVSDFKGTL